MTYALDWAVKAQMTRAALARDCEKVEALVAEAESALGHARDQQVAAAIGEARLLLERIQTTLTILGIP